MSNASIKELARISQDFGWTIRKNFYENSNLTNKNLAGFTRGILGNAVNNMKVEATRNK